MTKKIGIEQSLSDVEQALKQKGYDVVIRHIEHLRYVECSIFVRLFFFSDLIGILRKISDHDIYRGFHCIFIRVQLCVMKPMG